MILKTETQIQSLGPPPEKHADRVIAQMLRELVKARVNVDFNLKEIVRSVRDGNPRAQRRFAEKIMAATHPFTPAIGVDPGKRGRYSLSIRMLDGWNPVTKRLIVNESQIPLKPWVTMTCIEFRSKGRGFYECDASQLIFASHHALSRLAQRCGVKASIDLLHAVTSIWAMLIKTGSELPDGHELAFPLKLGFPLVVDGCLTGDTGIAVIDHYENDMGGLVVKTILDPVRSDEDQSITGENMET